VSMLSIAAILQRTLAYRLQRGQTNIVKYNVLGVLIFGM